MCGRFVLLTSLSQIQSTFNVTQADVQPEPSYNIAPTQPVVVVVQRAGSNALETMRWGLIPSWAKDAKIGAQMINARAETVAEKPSFKQSLLKRRCLVIANGFYEWHTVGNRKIPMFIQLKSGEPFGFAGLYDTWKSPTGESINSCAIITTTANELMQSIHDRMPVILSPDQQRVWLDAANQNIHQLVALLKPYPSDEMTAHPVSSLVNSPRNNSPECIRPVN